MKKIMKKMLAQVCVFALILTSVLQMPAQSVKAANDVKVCYRTHIQTYGWEGKTDKLNTWKQDGTMSGTSGQAKRLEGIEIVVQGNSNLGIRYTTHCQTYGWLPWSSDGEMNGTEGEAKRLEAIKIQLTGDDADKYDVYYRVHAQTYGWLAWAKNGQAAGTAGLAKRLEGIQIVVVPKGKTLPNEYKGITAANRSAYISSKGANDETVSGSEKTNVLYRTHVQTYGWQGWRYNGNMAGTSGQAKRLEGINIKLTNRKCGGGITYRTHVQTYGWQNWVSDGTMSGTSGEAKRLESIQIYLTGEMAKQYDVYYRVHAQTYGWLAWVKNGEPAGTAGYGKRLEGIQIVLVEKGAGTPGNVGGIASVSSKGFECKSVEQIPGNPYIEPKKENTTPNGGNNGSGNTGNTDNPGENGNTGDTDNPGGSGNTGDTDNPGGSGDTGDIDNPGGNGDTGDTDNPGGNGDTGDTDNPGGNGDTGDTDNPGDGGDTDKPDDKSDITQYTYKVIPLTEKVCGYFYVETDNPDPKSFTFVDEDSKITSKGTCTFWLADKFADVKYEDSDTYRVNGGYIFRGESTDGGELRLYEHSKYNIGDPTDITVTIPTLTSEEQYLIDTYTNDSMDFWEKMDALQEGLSNWCLYSTAYVLGDLTRNSYSPYYGLSNSPHVDQVFYIQSPYYRNGSKRMLVSELYPYILDSLSYPYTLKACAQMIEESVEWKWNSDYHYLIDFTYNGETKTYGGAGSGGGKGVYQNMVQYYKFDGTSDDLYGKNTWEEIGNTICKYGAMDVPEEDTELPELTWKDVRNIVGEEGGYVKLYDWTSKTDTKDGYTFVYNDNSGTIYGVGGYRNYKGLGYFSNAWYDGRYFNKYEVFEKGTTLEDETASTADIVIKNPVIRVPEDPDGKSIRHTTESSGYKDIKNFPEYDAETGVWHDYVHFKYHSDTQTWVATIYETTKYWDSENRRHCEINDPTYVDACTLTLEEAKAMGIDRNANTDPSSYYNFNRRVEPGTYETN